jgi:hypothetical protein
MTRSVLPSVYDRRRFTPAPKIVPDDFVTCAFVVKIGLRQIPDNKKGLPNRVTLFYYLKA